MVNLNLIARVRRIWWSGAHGGTRKSDRSVSLAQRNGGSEPRCYSTRGCATYSMRKSALAIPGAVWTIDIILGPPPRASLRPRNSFTLE
jgi:hypothetical protein